MGNGTEFADLQNAIGFTLLDLEANKAGHISPAQHERFIQRVQAAITQTMLMLMVITAVALLTQMYIVFVGVPGILIPIWWTLRARWLDDRDGKVLSVEGPARMETVGGTHGTEFHGIRIGETLFHYAEITDLICRAFHENTRYHVYYLPHSMTILSAEPETGTDPG